MVHGPVLRRLRTTYSGRGKSDVRRALESARYLALRASLDRLVDSPPWTPLADTPAGDLVPELLDHDLDRYRRRSRAAAQSGASVVAMHDVRKAAKRLRYAAEAVEPVVGKPARRLAREARRVTSHLGRVQDTTMTRAELLALARAAAAEGEPSFTYGRLHAHEEARAGAMISTFWTQDPLERLERRTRRTVAATSR